MTPLIDADILLHELGWSGQFKDKDTGEEVTLDFERVKDMLDEKIRLICADVEATEDPILFVTDSEEIVRRTNKLRQWQGLPLATFTPNFRYEVAKTKPYKGTRKNPKPFHFYNILFYLMAEYDVRVSEGGLEADDMVCIEQCRSDKDTIICSRDKDLRICPGWHFSWECGGQRSLGPTETDELGWLEMHEKKDKRGKVVDRKVFGYGLSFFYYQMLVGDSADNIPGLPKWGPAKAFNVLNGLETKEEMLQAVKSLYKETMGKKSKEYFLEQGNLLWMIQKEGQNFDIT